MIDLGVMSSPSTTSSESHLLDDMRREAEMNALKIIQAKLEKPENLEKLDQLKTAAAQRKRTLDEQLRTAVQSQLESIKTGIEQLQISLDNMKAVDRYMKDTDEKLQKVVPLQSKLEDLRAEANTYRQLSLARANLDYIINTPENVRKADEFMSSEKLLHAHNLIMDIENSRNYLLFELYKVQEKDNDDMQLLTSYFQDVDRLVSQLKSLISLRISRWYDCAISCPEKLVTALRIIEREEQVDRFWIEKKETTGFIPPDRPRQWKKNCFELLRKSVKDRIEGNQLDTREEHKYWLTRHLEMCRRIFLQDFQIITKSCTRCFPKHYDIVNRFLDYYHTLLKEHLTEICDPKRRTENDTLTIPEVYTIVTFAREYKGIECLGNPDLKLDLSQLSPLLEKDMLATVTNVFINERKQKFSEWLPNIINSEVKDWYACKEVELTQEHYYSTTMPRMLINMIIETLDMAKNMSDDVVEQILSIIIIKTQEFHEHYVRELNDYSRKYFLDRSKFKEHFTKQMVANANNCESLPLLMLLIRDKYDKIDIDQDFKTDRYKEIGKKFEHTAEVCCDIILREIELDCTKYLKLLLTREWFGGQNQFCGILIETTRDYWDTELTGLKKPLLQYLFYTWHKHILAYYLKNLLKPQSSQQIKFQNPQERRACAEQMKLEAQKLQREFIQWDGSSEQDRKEEYHFNMLEHFAEILQQTDLDSIVLDVATLAKKYPSLNMEFVINVLLMRGDLTKSEAKEKADAALANMPRINQGILSEILEIMDKLN